MTPLVNEGENDNAGRRITLRRDCRDTLYASENVRVSFFLRSGRRIDRMMREPRGDPAKSPHWFRRDRIV
jgi:hypothetical protein